MRFVVALVLLPFFDLYGQVDTSFIFNHSTTFGPLDIRIAKSLSEFYYLEEGTFSFRTSNGAETASFLDMTAWDSEAYLDGNMRLTTEEGADQFIMNYRYLKPPNYDHTYQPGYPLVIVLHGLHESGNCARSKCYHATTAYDPNANVPEAPRDQNSQLLNNDYNLIHGGRNFLEAHQMTGSSLPDDPALSARAFPGFVVFPQNLNGWDIAAAEDAIRLVRLFAKMYNVDENRIFINGISNGGHGAYEVLKRAPWLFAAGVLFSAADDASIISQKAESRISGIPLWIFQGGIDELPTQKQTEEYVKRFRNAGADIRYTLYDQIGHGTWNQGFLEPEFFSWLLRQRKNKLHVFGNNPSICSTNGKGATLSMPHGYKEYEWEFNGQTVSSSKNPVYIAKIEGSYRGRFKTSSGESAEWNEWSDPIIIIEKRLFEPQIKQLSTVVLKDPNGKNEATLEASEIHAHYRWFRNGTPLDLPGNADDTFKIITLNTDFGDGSYTLEVSDYDRCPSPTSDAKYVFFDDTAPVVLATPEDVGVSALSPSKVSVSWKDISDNEIGFEVWRRNISSSDTSSWVTSTLTTPNVTVYEDLDLKPLSAYEYMIRAVASIGRSDYSHKKSTITKADLEAPSPPIDLVAELTGTRKITLRWKPSHDDSSIKEYLIFTALDTIRTGNPDTSYVLNKFQLNTHYVFTVRSVDVSDNVSEASNDVKVSTKITGLFYEHSTGEWSSLDEINWSTAEYAGIIDSFSLSPKTQEDFFNFRFEGYLHIEKRGVYQFRLSSNDGSRLLLDDSLFILNDGIHNLASVTSPVHVFSEGPHRIAVDFFDSVLADTLSVEYKGGDTKNQWTSIPSHRLTSGALPLEEDQLSENPHFEIYPNPLPAEQLKFVFSTISTGAIVIRVLSSTGQEILRETIEGSNAAIDRRTPVTLNLLPLANGVYFIHVEQDNRLFKTKRLVVLK